jgi:hypothetical protein
MVDESEQLVCESKERQTVQTTKTGVNDETQTRTLGLCHPGFALPTWFRHPTSAPSA